MSGISLAALDIYTNTSFNSVSFSSDIVIHPGATLTLTGSIQITPGKSITVMDGAALHCNNGYIKGVIYSPLWQGIIIHNTASASPTTSLGLIMNNFRVEDAIIGIECIGIISSPHHNRRLDIQNTVFDNNERHIYVNNGAGIPYLANTEAFTYSDIYIDGCEFGNSPNTSPLDWMVDMRFTNFVTVKNTRFNSNSGYIAFHLNYPVNTTIEGCDFDGYNKIKLALHREIKNILIKNNDFDLSTSSNDKIGIDFTDMAAYPVNLDILANIFDAHGYNNQGSGILCAYSSQSEFEEITIANNSFLGLKYGAKLKHFNVSNSINKNEFMDCDYGLYFISENPDVEIKCNTFVSNNIDIYIDGGSQLMNQNFGYDPSNTFSSVSAGTYNIVNAGTNVFEYDYFSNMPIVPITSIIVLNNVSSDFDCNGYQNPPDPTESQVNNTSSNQQNSDRQQYLHKYKNPKAEFYLYPNPLTDILNISIYDVENPSFVIFDLQGKEIYRSFLNNGNNQLNISSLSSGLYLYSIFEIDTILETKKLVIQ